MVLSTFVLGFLRPQRAWHWALLVGLCVPGAEMLSDSVVPSVAGIPGLALLSAFVVALGLVGSYSGALVRRFAMMALGD